MAVFMAYLTPHPQVQINPAAQASAGDSIHGTRVVSQLPIWSLNSLAERLQLWQTSLRMAANNPLLGVGTGQWKIMMPHYGGIIKSEMTAEGIIEIQFQRPHNDYLWVLAENGLIGFIGYISFYIILAGYALKIAVKSKEADQKIFSLLMLFGLIGYMIIAFFAFPKERVVHTIFQMLIAASIVTVYHKAFPTGQTVSHRKMMLFNVAILVFVVFSGFIGYTRLTSEIHTRNGLEARLKGDWDRVIAEMDMAHSRFYSLDPTSTPLRWYRGMAQYALGHIEKARDDFNKAYRIHPYHVHVLNNLASCHALLNDTNSAVGYYIRTLETFPRFETGLINLCSLYLSMGKYTAANDVLQRFGQDLTSVRVAAIVKQVKSRLKAEIHH
jgi:tetratricopeptide (TPR) repeat protein